MPEHVTVNPNITVMMIGERCADLIRASRSGEPMAIEEMELTASLA
jgi:choline oxidase